MEDCRRRIEGLTTELAIIGRETAGGVATAERERSASEKLAAEEERLVGLKARWESEQGVLQQILDLRAQLRGGAAPVEGTGSTLELAASAAASSPAAAATPPADAVDAPAATPEAAAPAPGLTPGLTEAERAATLEKLRTLQTEPAHRGRAPQAL